MAGMKERRSPALIAVASLFLAVLRAAYRAGYFWLGEYEETSGLLGAEEPITRGYRSKLASEVYKPVAWIEQNLCGVTVHTWWMNDPDPFD